VLAQEYAWRNRERYCGVWWVRAEKPEILMDDLAALGARFIPGLPDKPEDAALKTVDQMAQMRTGKPWLLIYDNAEGPALLRGFTPADNAHVLITTRRTDWQDDADEELAVDVFDRDTAIAYLLKQARNLDADAAGRLADALKCLPLALSHARAYCWVRNRSFDKYIERLPELIDEAPKDAPYPDSVFATFSLAIKNAAAECAEAETLMALLAFFAPDKIPLWLIPEDVLSEKQREDALAALTSVSLAAHDNLPDGAPAVSVHRLVQEVMRGRLRNSGRFEDAAALAIRLIHAAYDASNSFESAPRNTAWLPHALAAVPHAPTSGPAAWHTLKTLIQIGDFRVSRGELVPARTAYEQGMRIAKRLVEADPENALWQRELAVAKNFVGNVLVAQGKLAEALSEYRVPTMKFLSASPRLIPARSAGSATSPSPTKR
jgi:tetratricopeptide (TPR) repeat protein